VKCHAVPDGATVRISQRTAFEPDAFVYCGEEVANDSLEVPNPVIVVEVLSPGTQMTDMRDKLRGDFSIQVQETAAATRMGFVDFSDS
jgi:Uma2 family endonuclease